MWIRIKETGQELNLSAFQAEDYVSQGKAVRIWPPPEEPKKVETLFQTPTPTTESLKSKYPELWKQMEQLIYDAGLPKQSWPIVFRLLKLEECVLNLQALIVNQYGVNDRLLDLKARVDKIERAKK